MTAKTLSFLLVDDDEDDSALFAEVLTDVDSSVRLQTAADGDQALRRLREDAALPDLIFLDLNMPRLSGRECLKQLKADDRLRQIPVVIYTTSSQAKDVEETKSGGATGFVAKPVSVKDLKLILAAFAGTAAGNWEATLQRLSREAGIFVRH